jgi:hypothetical protein
MHGAWLGCIHWALGDAGSVAAFRQETGNNWRPGNTPIERMIDTASGVDREFLFAFIRWANENIWGPVELAQAVDAVARGSASEHEPTTRVKS